MYAGQASHIQNMQETDYTELGCENLHLISSGTASDIVLRCRAQLRSAYTVKRMKLKLQGASLARIPSKALGGAPALYSHGHFFKFSKTTYFKRNRFKYYRTRSGRCFIKVFCYLYGFCDVCGIRQLFKICNSFISLYK